MVIYPGFCCDGNSKNSWAWTEETCGAGGQGSEGEREGPITFYVSEPMHWMRKDVKIGWGHGPGSPDASYYGYGETNTAHSGPVALGDRELPMTVPRS